VDAPHQNPDPLLIPAKAPEQGNKIGKYERGQQKVGCDHSDCRRRKTPGKRKTQYRKRRNKRRPPKVIGENVEQGSGKNEAPNPNDFAYKNVVLTEERAGSDDPGNQRTSEVLDGGMKLMISDVTRDSQIVRVIDSNLVDAPPSKPVKLGQIA